MQAEAGVLQQPVFDGGPLVGGVVVQDQVQVQVLRDGPVDQLEEAQELLMPGLGDDRAGEDRSNAASRLVVPLRT